MDNVVAMVFCGGEGTRLRPLSYLIRKEMLPIGRRRKPVLEFVVDHLRRNGIRNIVFLGSTPRGGDIANYFDDGNRFGVHITHQPDSIICTGTGHALLWAIKELELEKSELLVYYGDIINTVDLKELLRKHSSKDAAATLVVSRNYVIPKGIAQIDENDSVTDFDEKPSWNGPGAINLGLLAINSERLIQSCGGKLPATESELQKSPFRDVMGDIVTHLRKHDRVSAYVTPTPWVDIGSFEDYARVREDIDWLIGKSKDTRPTERGLRVFISYHISEENGKLIEEEVIPCLNLAGIRTVSGGRLDRDHKPNRPPVHIAKSEIDKSDGVIAFATSDTSDCSPSDYVKYEVDYALAKDKLLGLFVEKGTKLPDPWSEVWTWTDFQKKESGELIRNVLEKAKFG